MQKTSKSFGLTFNNIPTINLRNEFARYYNAVQEDHFLEQFQGGIKPIKTPYLIWYGMPDDLMRNPFYLDTESDSNWTPKSWYFLLPFRV